MKCIQYVMQVFLVKFVAPDYLANNRCNLICVKEQRSRRDDDTDDITSLTCPSFGPSFSPAILAMLLLTLALERPLSGLFSFFKLICRRGDPTLLSL